MRKSKKRAHRCTLAVPGSNYKMIEKAAALDVDQVFLDLEDAVAPNARHDARKLAIDALNELDFGNKVRSVRINATDTEWCHDDIIMIVEGVRENIDTIIVPKVKNVSDVLFVSTLLDQLEKKLKFKKSTGIEILIEEVEGLINCEKIALSTHRLESMIFGMGDFAASQGMHPNKIGNGYQDYPDDLWHYHRCRITMACRLAGIDAIDGPYVDFKDPDGLDRQTKRARMLGADGKWAIHPSQIEQIMTIFTPGPDEVAHARQCVVKYDEAKAGGKGAISVDGVLIDESSVRILSRLLEKADLYAD